MAAINSTTRAKIKGYLEGFIRGLIEEYKERKILPMNSSLEYLSRTSSKGGLKPFHAALVPPEIIRINQFERGLSTRLGNSYEECARLIALDHHQDVQRGMDFNGEVSLAAFAEAEVQKEKYESVAKKKGEKPLFAQMVDEVINSRQNYDLSIKSIRADLYILAKDGTEFFFEIKSPKPNKGQCLEVLQRLLRFHAARGTKRPQTQAYYAMPYNPYGLNKDSYHWSCASTYLPFDEVVLLGNEFWEIIGGETTYEELLDIYLEVGRENSKFMLDSLAFEF